MRAAAFWPLPVALALLLVTPGTAVASAPGWFLGTVTVPVAHQALGAARPGPAPAPASASPTSACVDASRGCSSPLPPSVEVTAESLAVHIAWSYVAGPAAAPATVDFEAMASGGTPPYTLTWDFGDGVVVSSLQPVQHTYAGAGSFRATARVHDALGSLATATTAVAVYRTSPPPSPAGSAYPPVATAGVTAVNFTVVSVPGTLIRADWNFGDGNFSTGPVARHAFGREGTYIVNLTTEYSANLAGYPSGTLWNASFLLTEPVVNGTTAPPLAAISNVSAVPEIGCTAGWRAAAIAAVAGGVAPYNYSWNTGRTTIYGPEFSLGGLSQRAGVLGLNLTITDGSGAVATTVGTAYAPSIPGSATDCGATPGPPVGLYLITGSVLAVIVIAIVFAVRRARSRR